MLRVTDDDGNIALDTATIVIGYFESVGTLPLSPARRAYGIAEYDSKLWITGGYANVGYSDVWSSSDGLSWRQLITNADFDDRCRHGSWVFGGRLWVFGGWNANDCWSTTNGVNWMGRTSMDGHYNNTYAYREGRAWRIGPDDFITRNTDPNIVLSTTDGATWTTINSAAPFGRREYAGLVYFDQKLYYVGGYLQGIDPYGHQVYSYTNDVWVSDDDGYQWNKIVEQGPFEPRSFHMLVTFRNKMLLAGGKSDSDELSDLWESTDGLTWKKVTDTAPFGKAYDFKCIVYQNKLFIFSYYGSDGYKYDMWNLY